MNVGHLHVKKIVHVFPIRGHSFLPCDRDFASIELRKRKIETLYVPDQWVQVIEEARIHNKFMVVQMEQSDFFDFKEHQNTFFKKNVKSSETKKKLLIRAGRMFIYETDQLFKVKTSMSEIETPIEYDIVKKNSTIVLPTSPLYTAPLPIKPAKLKDIQTLADKYIPEPYKSFYSNLTADDSQE